MDLSSVAQTGVRRAFVEGAQWWEYEIEDATMCPSDRNKAEAEAVRRYGAAPVCECDGGEYYRFCPFCGLMIDYKEVRDV